MTAVHVLVLLAAGLSGGAQVNDGLLDVAETLLAEWIKASRDTALAEGVTPIPDELRAELVGHVPEAVLETVRWRIGGGNAASLQMGTFAFHHSPAITLDYVIVFENATRAADARLWVHELTHVEQYQRWGIQGFARRYLQDYEAVERPAAEARWQWMKRTGRVPAPASAPQP